MSADQAFPLEPATLPDSLLAHLRSEYGEWPPEGLIIASSPARVRPRWNGKVDPFAAVHSPAGLLLSVPPPALDEARRLCPKGSPREVRRVARMVTGRSGTLVGYVFRWMCKSPVYENVGVWLSTDDSRVPEWLRNYSGDVLVAFSADGQVMAGLGRKRHDDWVDELAAVTEPPFRGRGLATALVAQATARVCEEGRIATALHLPSNIASARALDRIGYRTMEGVLFFEWARQRSPLRRIASATRKALSRAGIAKGRIS